MKRLLFPLLLLLLMAGTAAAEDVSSEECIITATGIHRREALFDMELEASQDVRADACLTLSARDGISGLYLVFDLPYGTLTLTEDERTVQVDTGGMLH